MGCPGYSGDYSYAYRPANAGHQMNENQVKISFSDKIPVEIAERIEAAVSNLSGVRCGIAYSQKSGIGSNKALISVEGRVPLTIYQQLTRILAQVGHGG